MDELREFRSKVEKKLNNISVKAWFVYLLSTGLMVFQHQTGWSWDFLLYSMNGKYLFADGIFMEWLRPPLASFLLGIPQILVSRALAEIIFIITVSTLFLYAAYRVSEEYDLNFEYFYLLLMMPATIYYGTINGTEMLSLAFAMLFLTELDCERSGLWLGLAFLSRYTYGIFIPLVLIQRDIEKSVKTLLISAVPVSLWILFNYVATGHPMKSFANFLGLQLFERSIHDPLNPLNLIIIGLPVSLLLILFLKEDVREKIDVYSDETLFVAGFAVSNLFLYLISNPKPLRYLYPMVLPVAFFATQAVQQKDVFSLNDREIEINTVIAVFSVFSILAASLMIVANPLAPPQNFREAAESSEGCMAQSNVWPMISYAGTPTLPVTQDEELVIEKGYTIIDYHDRMYNGSANLPVIENTSYYTTYGNKTLCRKPETADKSWIETDLNIQEGMNHTPESYLIFELKTRLP